MKKHRAISPKGLHGAFLFSVSKSPHGAQVVSKVRDGIVKRQMAYSSPYGVQVVSYVCVDTKLNIRVFVPLRGVNCIPRVERAIRHAIVFVPLRGVNCVGKTIQLTAEGFICLCVIIPPQAKNVKRLFKETRQTFLRSGIVSV